MPIVQRVFLFQFSFFGALIVCALLVVVPLVRPRLRYACGQSARWGLGVGLVLFLAGFIGPIVLSPGANQGPLLGIFITGPLGFIAGCVVGFLRFVGHAPPEAR